MNKSEIKESLAYLCMWALLFLSAIISVYVRTTHDTSLTFNWDEVFMMWRTFIPFLAVFLIHNYAIAPLLVYKKKGWLYVGLTLAAVVVFQLYTCRPRPEMQGRPQPLSHIERHGQPPSDRPPLPVGKDMPHDMPDLQRQPGPHPEGEMGMPPVFGEQRNLLALIVLTLMLGMNLGVKQYFKSAKDAKALAELEKRNLEQQLEYLKYQINPHFFMNTLNNIHALVDIDPEEAKNTILELSKLMRYVLYEGAKSRVPLKRDIDFLQHYISLMRLRYTDRVSISVDIPSDLPDCLIPPMLFITFVENAFKHGVSYKKASTIDIGMAMKNERLSFTCRNSKAEIEHQEGQQGGVGLQNTRQRLQLIYGHDYSLEICDNIDMYEVCLEIPVYQE